MTQNAHTTAPATMPLVSVIMAMYNAAPYVAEAIQSVLQQTYSNWELLVVDDGSTDASASIVQSHTDRRIRYFHQANGGVSSARNKGLANRQGDFFCFLDADDVMPPNALLARLNKFAPGIHFVDGAVELYNSGLQRKLKTWRPAFAGPPFQQLIRLDERCFFGCTWMIRGGKDLPYRFDEALRYGEELAFYMDIAHLGHYTFTDETILWYRRSDATAMANLDGLANGYRQLFERVARRFPGRVSAGDKLFFDLKIRKIMFLSFVAARQYRKACRFLLTRRV